MNYICKIEITIPVLNEAPTLDRNIRIINDYVNSHLSSIGAINIIIVDNGSNDGTSEIATRLANTISNIKFISLPERGVGLALKSSWIGSNADIIGYMDLDLATDLRYLGPAIEALILNNADIVTGSRLLGDSKVIGRSIRREIISRCLNLLLQFIFRIKFSDGMCGFKFLKKSVLSEIIDNGATSNGWFFASEVLIVADRLGLRTLDLPVEWRDDSNSKVKIFKLSLEYLKAISILRKKLLTRGLL